MVLKPHLFKLPERFQETKVRANRADVENVDYRALCFSRFPNAA